MTDTWSWLDELRKVAPRQRCKDELTMETIRRYFVPGTVLEIGSGIGQLATILAGMGVKITASDIDPSLVDYMQAQGIKSIVIDARRINRCIASKFDNVLASALSPLQSTDLKAVEETYNSVFNILNPGGRFVIMQATGYDYRRKWNRMEQHFPLIRQTGFVLKHFFRNQALPSSYYSRLPKLLLKIADATAGRLVGVRYILVLEKPFAESHARVCAEEEACGTALSRMCN